MAESKPDLLWDESRPAAESARQVLPKLAADFFHRGRMVVTSAPSPQELHKLRLDVKRFRYTLELFRPCYGNGLEQRLEALKRMQDHLGAMNDCEVAAGLLRSAEPNSESAEEFLRFLAERSQKEQQTFLNHWQETFDAPGQEEWWVEYLTRPESLGSGRALEQTENESESALRKTATA